MDPLTKLDTRNEFELLLNEGVINLANYASLILFDIDTLIAINDLYGNIKADSYLQDFTFNLKNHFKEPNLCFRYRGDEFVVLLTNALNIEDDTKEILKDSIDKNCIINVEYSNIKFYSVSACIVKNLSARTYTELTLELDNAIIGIEAAKEHLENRKYKKQGVLAII